jgi:D-alanyl-D-alanine carboxypeptidase
VPRQNEHVIFESFEQQLGNMVARKKDLKHALCLIHSDKHDLHWKYAVGTTGPQNEPIHVDQPYHIASIGKTFTSMLVARLHERGTLQYDDPIAKYLSAEMLRGLFVYTGVDYADQVLVRQLLNHTSGVADYYEDKPLRGKSMKVLAVEEPDRFWTPDDLISYSRNNQRAFSAPGKRFHYSDTGYALLGKIVEQVSNRSFHENLHAEIFDPLGMEHSCFHLRSEPKDCSSYPMADVYLGEHEVSSFQSFSIDWAGGGIVSTMEDLLRFHQALVKNTIISRETLERCKQDVGRFGFGMDYGYGILHLKINQLGLIMPKALNMWGNFGSFGSYMFYNPVHDVYIIGAFNHSNYVVKQVQFMINVIRKLHKHYRS